VSGLDYTTTQRGGTEVHSLRIYGLDGGNTETTVVLEIDLPKLVSRLASRAQASKGRRTQLAYGCVKLKLGPSTKV
jgi:hypothetical protein